MSRSTIERVDHPTVTGVKVDWMEKYRNDPLLYFYVDGLPNPDLFVWDMKTTGRDTIAFFGEHPDGWIRYGCVHRREFRGDPLNGGTALTEREVGFVGALSLNMHMRDGQHIKIDRGVWSSSAAAMAELGFTDSIECALYETSWSDLTALGGYALKLDAARTYFAEHMPQIELYQRGAKPARREDRDVDVSGEQASIIGYAMAPSWTVKLVGEPPKNA